MARGKSPAFDALILIVLLSGAMMPGILDAGAAHAAVLRVPDQYPTIFSALDAALPGDRVEVQPGVYYEHGLRLRAGVLLTGMEEDPTATVIDGQGRGRILNATSPGPIGQVARLTFQNGWARGENSYDKSGGAIYINQAKLQIIDCRFAGNLAEAHGGAIRVMRATPPFINCEFVGNTALGGGGGAVDCSYEASPLLEDCSFRQNLSSWGGAISARGQSDPRILRGEFYSNRTDGDDSFGGGALSFFDSQPQYLYSTFYGNRAVRGGAVAALPGAPARLEHCTVTQNLATHGAGLFSRDASSVIESSIVVFQNGSGVTAEGPLVAQISDSNVHGNSGGDLVGLLPGVEDSDGNISADPLFCDLDGGLSFNVDIESPVVSEGEGGTMGAWLAGCAGERGIQYPAPDLPRILSIEGLQAAPNPFNPSTRIRFQLESAQRIRAEVYAVDGRRVRVLADRVYQAGWNLLQWNGRDDGGRGVSSGAYVVLVQGEAETKTHKITLLK